MYFKWYLCYRKTIRLICLGFHCVIPRCRPGFMKHTPAFTITQIHNTEQLNKLTVKILCDLFLCQLRGGRPQLYVDREMKAEIIRLVI